MQVSIDKIVKLLDCDVLHKKDNCDINWVVASGLMSDVLTTEQEDFLLVTGLTTTQVIRTADMVQAKAVLIISGKNIPQDTIDLARETNICLIRTDLPKYEACVLLGDLFPVDIRP